MTSRPNNFLVLNCGSSSLSYKVLAYTGSETITSVLSGKASRVGVKGTEPSSIETHFNGTVQSNVVPLENHRAAARAALSSVKALGVPIDFVGHRFVHGGAHFQNSVFLTGETLRKLKLCRPLAPIHNPNSLSVIQECKRVLPNVPQYVAFDTAFHHTIPVHCYTYALPKSITQKFGFRKYGFHGLSYQYVTQEVARSPGLSLDGLRIVACHLGTGGSSVAAIRDGKSVDTSMGYSPLQGLVMSTRSGDIDPMLATYLMTVYGYRPDELSDLLSKQSGLLGVSGFSSDIRDIIRGVNGPEKEQAELALNMYIHRLKKYIGNCIAILGGIDVLVFTDDIGVHNWLVREMVCENMEWCGIVLDKEANRKAVDDQKSSLGAGGPGVEILIVPTDEELVICLEGIKLMGAPHAITI